jgi:Porin subfamily
MVDDGSMKIASNSRRGVLVGLLGTAAGVAMLSGVQAAELEGQSQAVPFVKICTQDGRYSYIPGTDACAGGLALTIGTDQRHSKSLVNLPGKARLAAQPAGPSEVWPDPAIALRAERSWGIATLLGGAHNVGSNYSGDGSVTSSATFSALAACPQAGAADCTRNKDNPGYFVGLEGEMKAPLFGAGDRIGAGIRFSQGGTSGFGGSLNLATPDLFGAGNAAAGIDSGAGLELTKAWSVQAGYDHQWAPNLNTSVFAGYSNVGVDGDLTNYLMTMTCGSAATGSAGCKSNWGNVGAGLRTSWAPTSGLTLSVQTMYNYVWSGFSGNAGSFSGSPAGRPADGSAFANQGVWSSYLRINRTFNSGE